MSESKSGASARETIMSKRWAILLSVALALPAFAQNYPAKNVRIVVPFPAGGATDVFARLLAQRLNDKYGQWFIVDNRPGATGTIGAAMVAKSPADGYTLVMHSPSSYTAGYMYKSVPYDAERDFTPVINGVTYPFYMVANPSVPVRNVTELIALAKRRPGEIPFSSSGVGSGAHLVMEMLMSAAGISMVHVPFKGSVQSMSALVGGEILVGWDNMYVAHPFVKAGKARAPTFAEQGMPGVVGYGWFGVVAPAGTPAAIVERLNADLAQIAQTPAMRDWMMTNVGGEFTPNTPRQFAEFLAVDTARWKKIIKETGARLD
jgi:tripartite-type tricarboxylate transporter receptor subunit TctC